MSSSSPSSPEANSRLRNSSGSSHHSSLDFIGADDAEDVEYEGDYNTRMAELMSEDGDGSSQLELGGDSDEEGEGFMYTGVDADVPSSYADQLRAVLGPEHESEDEGGDWEELRASLAQPEPEELEAMATHSHDSYSDATPSTSSVGLPATPPRTGTPSSQLLHSQLARPFLHPAVSRLRSYTPQSSRVQSPNSFFGVSPSPSHFSSLSRVSSSSNLHSQSSVDHQGESSTSDEREVFRWTQLRNVTSHLYPPMSNKASSVMGGFPLGSPTVLAANGLLCVGTDQGRICVYDFQQNLKCVCGDESSLKTVGSVTALALSHDHTYIVSGHATGFVQLYDLKNPRIPARTVAPTNISAIMSGRQEGHLQGSRIVSVGFIAGRHTAIVSADEHGLAFFHSLGKVLFVEAPDILRILGTYPIEEAEKSRTNVSLQRRRSRFTVLAMVPLPLGTVPHPTDAYNIIALLTPKKLVVVSLKPTPKTWFKCPRGDLRNGTRRRGAMSWYPSVIPGAVEPSAKVSMSKADIGTIPTLAYSWAHTLHLIRVFEVKVKQDMRNSRTGRTKQIEAGNIVHEEFGKWVADADILALQWLNVKQIIVVTANTLEVFDVTLMKPIERVQYDSLSLISPSLILTSQGTLSYTESVNDIGHSVRVYKGKIFMLGREDIEVGTLLTWADRILTYVDKGDFLSAIELTRSYYTGEAPGNKNGLPDDVEGRKEVTELRIRELMVASTQYAFSEDRMTDGTHNAPDGRGVDRTSLFEGLVSTCARASIALDNFDFFFEDLFQYYDDAGISRIFLTKLEPFVLDNDIRYVPPRITQRLISLHDEDGRPDLVERIIWHIDPACLDINQAIHLCQSHRLYDALIYVYASALHDYVAPIVELLTIIRKIQKFRRIGFEESLNTDDPINFEATLTNAYKIYPYLANLLAGLGYPGGEPLNADEAAHAKKVIYGFLFSGRSLVWPPGDGGALVLTSPNEGGVEPTYPYVGALLEFDAESFLHSLDIAFEDGYLNDESQGVSRLLVVKILLELLQSRDLSQGDITFVNIFIARNVPKYPQFLHLAPSVLHSILIALAEDPDPTSREDRQLAAEYLLSVYTPHDNEHIADIFQLAGFFRILRTWHRQEHQWIPWLATILDDPDFHSTDVFPGVEEVVTLATWANKNIIPPDVTKAVADALPRLLRYDISQTAHFLQHHLPQLHDRALSETDDRGQYDYLSHLLGPPQNDEVNSRVPAWAPGAKPEPPLDLVQRYVSLHCKFHPESIISVLQYLPHDLLKWDQVVDACESNGAYSASVWALNQCGDPQQALSKAEVYEGQVMIQVLQSLSASDSDSDQDATDVYQHIQMLQSIARTAVDICLTQSNSLSTTEVPLEDIWFQVLSSQISCVQRVSSLYNSVHPLKHPADPDPVAEKTWKTLSSLRAIVQETFGSLVSVTSTRAVSFPRLFKRLVNTASRTELSTGAHYDEFRSILTGMLESYRSDGDILSISKHLVDRDLFETIAEATKERVRGWAAPQKSCAFCHKALLLQNTQAQTIQSLHIIVSRTGSIYHSTCLP